jgi:Zn finger protein HypA/HybF involved in hydrogenase expression
MTKKQNMATGKELNEIELDRTVQKYKCPTCKHAISIKRAEFIKGIAMTSCGDCGSNAFAIEDVLLN